jgi:SAM-dependent methyltransferase
MTQNIYDDDDFFREYSRLPRSVAGLDAAPEWPALRALLPDLDGLTVVDLGCGFGWFCRWVREQGSTSVLGIDASEKMLARAIAATGDPAMTYTRADMEWLELPPASFDLAYSSLALHYVEELDRLISVVYRSLAEGGNFVFSVEHPIFTAPSEPRWSTNSAGRKIWPVDSYLEEGPRRTDWLAKGVVKQHRTLGSYLNMLIRVGFAIRHVEEWGPTPEQIAAHLGWADERQRPPFLLIAAKKPGVDRRPHAVGARNQFHADNKQATGQSQA